MDEQVTYKGNVSGKLIFRVSIVLAWFTVFLSCENKSISISTDAALFNEIVSTSGYIYYNAGDLVPLVPESEHGNFRLRFNAVAASVMDAGLELPAGATFPTGSIIVKEVHTGNDITLYAVMKKDPENPNAGSGWLWAELSPTGTPVFSIANKGSGCVPCHSLMPNRDLSRTFDLH